MSLNRFYVYGAHLGLSQFSCSINVLKTRCRQTGSGIRRVCTCPADGGWGGRRRTRMSFTHDQ